MVRADESDIDVTRECLLGMAVSLSFNLIVPFVKGPMDCGPLAACFACTSLD